MHSLDKINTLRSELMGPPSENPDAIELGLRTVVHVAAPLVAKILPDDPAHVDEFLEDVALKLLELRSDSAPLSEQFLTHTFGLIAQSLPDGVELPVVAPFVESSPAPAPQPAAAPAAPTAPEAPAGAPVSAGTPAPAEPSPAPAPDPTPASAESTGSSPSSAIESSSSSADSSAPSSTPAPSTAPADEGKKEAPAPPPPWGA
jgi:hypothetical protein